MQLILSLELVYNYIMIPVLVARCVKNHLFIPKTVEQQIQKLSVQWDLIYPNSLGPDPVRNFG